MENVQEVVKGDMSASGFLPGRLRRAPIWILLVLGCAAPLLVITWPGLEAAGRVGEVSGILVWIVLLVVWDQRRRSYPGAQVPNTIRTGAPVLLVLQGVAALSLAPLDFALLYAPTLLSSAILRYLPDELPFFQTLILTLLSGTQVAVCAWGLGRLIEALRPRLAGAGARLRR